MHFGMKRCHLPNRYLPALPEQIDFEYRQVRSIRALANDYEPCEATMRHWVEADAEIHLDESEADELKRLRKENKQLWEGKLTLETSVAWFAGLVTVPTSATAS